MIRKIFRQFRSNPVRGATVYTAPDGHDVWHGVVALQKDGYEPILYTHSSILKTLSSRNSVRFEGDDLIIKRAGRPELRINGFELERVQNAALEYQWQIFHSLPEYQQRRVTEF